MGRVLVVSELDRCCVCVCVCVRVRDTLSLTIQPNNKKMDRWYPVESIKRSQWYPVPFFPLYTFYKIIWEIINRIIRSMAEQY